MASHIFSSLLNEKIERFKLSFQTTGAQLFKEESGITHAGEFGSFREHACKELLELIIPSRLSIGSGFLISSLNNKSKQCDIVIYDKLYSPKLEDESRKRFFPVEVVSAIGEIKSDLSLLKLKQALNKLARNKSLREEIKHPSLSNSSLKHKFQPSINPDDHVFSFLICNRLTFDHRPLPTFLETIYDQDIQPWQKHNMILSLEDGLFFYANPQERKTLSYPSIGSLRFQNAGLKIEQKHDHLYVACQQLFNGTSRSNIFHVELSDYLW